MARAHLGRIPAFSTIGWEEKQAVLDSLKKPLSGYIGGDATGGYWVERLAASWSAEFNVPYAIPCNSATSGLLAACMAVGIGPKDEVWTTPYSMSATAACAKVLGATIRFIDIEMERFGIEPGNLHGRQGAPKAIIVTNLFGHPAKLAILKEWCNARNVWLIEDNAQAPMAKESGQYTGTVGHIGVFSLNVHKHIQCGEGGVIVTHQAGLAIKLQGCINHGELDHKYPCLGLNLRMTEPIAAIACAQLAKAQAVIEGRREIGLELSDMVMGIPWVTPHTDQPNCKHVYYLWTALIDTQLRRGEFVTRLMERGVPIRSKYAPLLHKMWGFMDRCPVVEDVDKRIVVFEVCAHDLKSHHLKTMREIINRVVGEMDEDRAA